MSTAIRPRRRPRLRFVVEALEGRACPSTFPVTSPLDTPDPGTLRWAITQADQATDDATITFDVTGTITLNTALPDLNKPSGTLTIAGPGASSSTIARSAAPGTPDFRIVTIDPGTAASIDGLTITGGQASEGGGIYNNQGVLDVTDCVITDNTANSGGGIYNFHNPATLTNTVVRGNTANDGGGILSAFGTTTLVDSTVSGNTASVQGGGLLIFTGWAYLTDSTVSGNRAETGGGIWLTAIIAATLTDTTVAGNTASLGGGIHIDAGLPTTTLQNSILADNEAPTAKDGSGAFTSQGHNLIGDTSGSTGWAAPDILNQDPKLGPPADNGGPTQTMALLPGSPAIDNGVAVPGITTDQRGVARPQGKAPDIGAYELIQNATGLPPVASAGGPYTIAEGQSLTLDASASYSPDGYPLNYTWTVDGHAGAATGVSPTLSWAQLQTLGVDDRGSFTLSVQVVDSPGQADTSPSATLTVTAVAPTAAFTNDGPIAPGGTATVQFVNPYDPSSADTAAGFHYAFATDPTALAGATYASSGTSPTATYTFAACAYTVFGRIIDKDNGFTQYSTTVHVATPGDITGEVQIAQSGFTYNRTTHDFLQSVTITNTGNQPLGAPMALVLVDLTPGVTLANATGTAPDGSPEVAVPLGGSDALAPGQAVTLTLQFSDPSLVQIAYTPKLLATPAPASDVTAQATITLGGFTYDRTTGHFFESVTITSASDSAFVGPLALALDGLTGGVTLFNAAGATAATSPAGSPYASLPGAPAPGQSVTIVLVFVDPGLVQIGFHARLLDGPGPF